MRLVFGLALIIGLSACSSKTKNADEGKSTEAAAAQPKTVAVGNEAVVKVSEKNETKKTEVKATGKKVSKQTKEENASSSVSGKSNVTCKSGQDERLINIKIKEKGCELEYTKSGQASVVASQVIGSEKCETVSTKIHEKLLAAGFKCE